MSENLARCRRCHDVFDPDTGICPRCGTPWQPIAAPPPPEEGTYADRYKGTEFGESEVTPVVMAPPSNRPTILIIAGAAVLSLSLLVGLAFSMGAFGDSKVPAIIVSVAPPTSAPPTPTTRPEIAMTIDSLNNPDLSAHIVIQSRADVDSTVQGHPFSVIINLDAQVSRGKEQAIYTVGGKSQEMRFVDGKIFVRAIPGTKWTTSGVVSSYVMLVPMFGLTNPKSLEFVGNEDRDGQQVYHFRTTKWWKADLSRMALMDSSALGTNPDTEVLDLWTTSFGDPVYASFSAISASRDGKKLLDIETTYSFTDVGTKVDVLNPLATPVPSASPSAS